jgi:hypothetical protein
MKVLKPVKYSPSHQTITSKKENRKKNKLLFSLDGGLDDLENEFGKNEPRRIRGFVEAKQFGKKTFIVDFQLSGGAFFNWTLLDMAKDVQGVGALKWILEKDFPDEVKECIHGHFIDLGYDANQETSIQLDKDSPIFTLLNNR